MCDCNRALELISLRLDGMLSPAEEGMLSEHLAACPDCRAAARALEGIHAAMPDLLEEPPEDFHRRVMEKIASERVIPFPVPKTEKRVWKTWLSTAAVFALIILGGSGLLRSGLLGGGAPTAGASPAATPEAVTNSIHEGAPPQESSQIQRYDTMTAQEDQPLPSDMGELGKETVPTPSPLQPQMFSGQTPPPLPSVGLQTAPLPTAPAQAAVTPEVPSDEPRTAIQARMPTPPELAAQQLGETQWPGATLTLLYDEAGGLLGLQVDLDAERHITLACLGLSPNDLYCEFQPDGQETDRFAVALDGSGILSRQTDAAVYDAAVAE